MQHIACSASRAVHAACEILKQDKKYFNFCATLIYPWSLYPWCEFSRVYNLAG